MVPHIAKEYTFRGNPFKVACVESFDFHPTWFTYVDEDQVRESMWNVQSGQNVLDVGAAFGSYTMCALSAGAASVWAWSPQDVPGLCKESDFFKATLELNGWSDRCKIYETGVYDRHGYLHTGDQTITDEPREGWEIIEVEPLDEWADRELPVGTRIDWMKLDVEGAEVEVLRSGSKFIRAHMPNVLVENHAFKRASIEQEVRDVMLSMGYREVATVPHHGVTHSLYVPL